jgi:hypothetical protein
MSLSAYSAEIPSCSKKYVKFRKGSMSSANGQKEEYTYSLMPKFWGMERYVADELFFEKLNDSLIYKDVIIKQFSKGREIKSKTLKLEKYKKIENFYVIKKFKLEEFIDLKSLESGELQFILHANGTDQCSFKVELLDTPPSY